MTATVGTGRFTYQVAAGWGRLPDGWSLNDVAAVAVDRQDRVYVFNRGEHPLIVFDRDGNVLRSFGEGIFSNRTHGLHIGPDDSVYCVDDGRNTIQKFTPEGKLLMTLGEPNKPSAKWQGEPFN